MKMAYLIRQAHYKNKENYIWRSKISIDKAQQQASSGNAS